MPSSPPRKDFLIRCGFCQATVQVNTDWISKKVRCSACQAVIVVPPPPAPVSAQPAAVPVPPDISDRVAIESSDALMPAAPEDSHVGPAIPGEQAQSHPVLEGRLMDGVPVRPFMRLLNRLADLKAQFLAVRGNPAEAGAGASKAADETAQAILADIRETVRRTQIAVKKMHKAHGDKVFPVLVRLRDTDPAVSDRELREILYQAMKTFPEQFAAWEKAQALAEKKIRDATLEQEKRMNRAFAAYQKGQYPQAIEDFEKLVKERPLNGQVRKFLGLSYLKLKQYEPAAVHLSVALSVGSESAPMHYDLAVALLQAGHVNAAMRQLRLALSLTPDFKPAVELLTRIEKDVG